LSAVAVGESGSWSKAVLMLLSLPRAGTAMLPENDLHRRVVGTINWCLEFAIAQSQLTADLRPHGIPCC